MKKYTIQIIILVLLGGLIIISQFTPYGTSRLLDMLKVGKNSTIQELRDFSIHDTASIDRIFMVNKESSIVDLTRSDNGWLVNKEFEANRYSVNLLLSTIKRMTIKNPVAKSAEENIIKRLATKSVKVEVYSSEKLIKTYFIGGVTQDQHGTYAMIKGSSKPFVISIPGFRGYLSSRFNTNELGWRSTRVFTFEETLIDQIDVSVGRVNNQSFSVKVNGKNDYTLYNADHVSAKSFDTATMRRFVKDFKHKFFSSFVAFKDQQDIDSTYNSPHLYRYDVKLNDGRRVELSLHKIEGYTPVDEQDIDLLNGIINQKNWVSIQTHIFAPMFKELDDFNPRF